MTFLYNSKSLNKARTLRRQQTDAERLLWTQVRGRQLAGYKFYRQYPIGKYIVDFYCPEKKLVIELDGSQHMQKTEYDYVRTVYLNHMEITVMRFWDNEIFQNLYEVLEKIHFYLTH